MSILNLPPKANGGRQMLILFLRDPVAIDAAAVDQLDKHGLLTEHNRHLASQLLKEAERAGVGQTRYFVERIAF